MRLFKRTLPPAAAPLSSRDFINGLFGLFNGRREIERFSNEIRTYFGVKHCFLVSSGRAALSLILSALHDLYPDRNEVIIPAYTCFSVPASIVRAGLKIRLCDIDAETLDFDYNQLNFLLSNKKFSSCNNRFLCIVPTHLFGIPSDIKRAKTIISDRDIPIIEDAAQAFGAEDKKLMLGTHGDVGFFSLGRGKAFSTVEGGVILTNRDDIAGRLAEKMAAIDCVNIIHLLALIVKAAALCIFTRPFLFWVPSIMSFLRLGETIYEPAYPIRRYSAFQAGLSRNWIEKINHFKKIRRKIVQKWINVAKVKNLYAYIQKRGVKYDLIRFPIRFDDASQRNRVLLRSSEFGLGIMPGYQTSIKRISSLEEYLGDQNCPQADRTAHILMTFPVHPFIEQRDINKIMAHLDEIR